MILTNIVFVIFVLIYIYYTIKTLNMREDLKGNPDPLGFMYVFNLSVLFGLKNEFPKNKSYSLLYKRYTLAKYICLVVFLLAIIYFLFIGPYL